VERRQEDLLGQDHEDERRQGLSFGPIGDTVTNTSSAPAGWYHAPGDPDGTQRYWDGARWVGDPQPVQGVAPAGYQAYSSSARALVPAEYLQRIIAYVIDYALVMVPAVLVGVVAVFVGTASGGLGVVIGVVGALAVIGFSIWNWFIRQGSTGQTIGKSQQNIKLITDETAQPPGGGMTFVRYLVAGLISNVTCGIYGILDILWPLWDVDKKRLTDKILKMSVVQA
jgi:uncharacterized RDD family membrane protein YckC